MKTSNPANRYSSSSPNSQSGFSDSSRNSQNTPGLPYEAVAARAYEIWEEEGCPSGRDYENWLEAERQLRRAPGTIRSERRPNDLDDDEPTSSRSDSSSGSYTRDTRDTSRSGGRRGSGSLDV